MQKTIKQNRSSGFATVKLMLIVIIIVIISGALVYTFIQKDLNTQTNNSDVVNNPSKTTLTEGTTSSILTLTEQDSQIETSVDSGFDDSVEQNVTSANSAASNLGGVYNESDF